jgi:hypothetical protein
MNTVLKHYFYDWFTADFLKSELDRLFKLFAPLYAEYLPDLSVRVVDFSPAGEAAKSFFDEEAVEIYSDYHTLYPHEHKVTLLHEAGHFVFSKDHSKFEDYFDYLKFRQKFIEEQVIPESYSDFLYCKRVRKEAYTFQCSGCKSSVVGTSFNDAHCGGCNRTMLLVGGL